MAIDFPSSPNDGQKFYQKGTLYSWVAAKSRWDAAPLTTALPFNLLVNPAFQISQQNAGFGDFSGFYPADQWIMGQNRVSGTWFSMEVWRKASPSPNGSRHYLQCTVGNDIPGAVNTADYYIIYQNLEGNRVAQTKFGTASAEQLVMVDESKRLCPRARLGIEQR